MKTDSGYTAVNDKQKEALDILNAAFTTVENFINTLVPAGRRQALALTNLEQASMWANKAVAKEWAAYWAEKKRQQELHS